MIFGKLNISGIHEYLYAWTVGVCIGIHVRESVPYTTFAFKFTNFFLYSNKLLLFQRWVFCQLGYLFANAFCVAWGRRH